MTKPTKQDWRADYGHGFDTGLVQELADECGSTYEQAEKIVIEFVIPELDGFFERGGKAGKEKNDFTMYLWQDASGRLDDLVEGVNRDAMPCRYCDGSGYSVLDGVNTRTGTNSSSPIELDEEVICGSCPAGGEALRSRLTTEEDE